MGSTQLQNTNYTLCPVKPTSVGFDEFIKVGQLFMDSFEGDKFFEWRHGPEYKYDKEWQVEHSDSSDQEEQLPPVSSKSSAAYNRLALARARRFYLASMEPQNVAYTVYDRDRLVAFVSWSLPTHMRGYGYARLGNKASGIRYVLWKLMLEWLKLKNKVLDWFTFVGREHPIINSRSEEYFQKESEAEKEAFKAATDYHLSSMTYEELKTAQYPRARQVRLDFLMVDPRYQRCGIGKNLVLQTLDAVPNVDTVFENHGHRSVGPQHVGLRGSTAGLKLYEKCGFVVKPSPFTYQNDEYSFTITHMELMREPVNRGIPKS